MVTYITYYVIEQLIPALREDHNKETTLELILNNTADFIYYYGYKNLHVATVTRWMNTLGYGYDVKKKHYFNNRHNEANNVLYRGKFVDRYFNYEQQYFCWIRIPKYELMKLIVDGNVLPQ